MIVARFVALTLSLSVAAVAVADAGCRRAPSFAEPTITSLFITSAAYGDFNEDGRPDAALMLSGDSRIIALNRGTVFQPMPREIVPGGSSSDLVAAGDVNHDGHLDLIYRRYNYVQVALGWGDGTFKPLLPTLLPRNKTGSWRIVDFDHDGTPDFVDFDFDSGGFTFVKSKGDGTFGEVGHVDLSGGFLQNIFTTAGDFDGDGNVDVVRIATELPSFSTSVTFGWNDGNFHFAETKETIPVGFSLQPVDIDGDGAEELVTIDDGSLVILRARNRHVAIERIPVAPPGTRQVLNNPMMLDANGDGIRDLVFNTGNAIGVVWGTAGNHFRDASYFELPGSRSFAAVDLDGDGVPDMAATSGSEGLPVLYGAALAAGSPNANRVYPVGFNPATLALADVDGDGSRDLVTIADQSTDPLRVMVLFGDGHGAFARAAKPFVMPARYSGSRGFVGDFDGDGRADLAVTSSSITTQPIIAFGSSDGFETPSLEIPADSLLGRISLGSPATQGLIALKGDDVLLVTISSGRNVTASTIYHRPSGAGILVVRSDANAPPRIAVVTANDIRLVSRVAGSWQESVLVAGSYTGTSGIASADFDGDGRADFVIWDSSAEVFLARSDGSYRTQGLQTAIGFIDSITPADFDGDGTPDLVVTTRGNFGAPGIVQVLRNAGGSFQPYATAMSGAPFRNGVVVDDVDGDGRPDVMIPSFDGPEVLRNICVTPRIRVAAVPANPSDGGHVTLVIHALSTDAFAIGVITISEGQTVLARQQPDLAYDLATVSWTSAALTPGTHTFRIDYNDQFGGSSQTEVVVTTKPAIPKHRAARR
ncbi:MAG TPA: FG-GAP-like repeat-containing protein [Thermoanaerobaculia bacterium]|jgi:hypothetical protein|nr:FG-GAP-like repeat-containing protein [Thermoanaerobaculia bacterium]